MQTPTEDRALLRVDATPALRRRVKIRAAQLGVSMQRYVTEAVEQRLAAEDARRVVGDDGHEGDAARAWHALDAVLGKTREGRDTLEGAGLERLAEEFQRVVDALELAHAGAEKKLAKVS